MTTIIEADAQGVLHIPTEAQGDVKPGTRYVLERRGDEFVLRPEAQPSAWDMQTPEERVAAFLAWANRTRPYAPVLPDEVLRRENMYE